MEVYPAGWVLLDHHYQAFDAGVIGLILVMLYVELAQQERAFEIVRPVCGASSGHLTER